MISRSISNEGTFSNFENFINVRLNRLDSKDEESITSEMDSRSNSIVDEDNYKESTCTYSEPIPIPPPYKTRTREVNYDGKTTSDKRCLTPTPTKYFLQIEENSQKIHNMFANQ